MAPKERGRNNYSSSSCGYTLFLDDEKEDHFETIHRKGIVQERSIDFPNITSHPRMQEIAEAYGWMNFNNMIGNINIT
ncbi:hypothetical protein A2U01_0036587 [Trifolium medium]|uniref:Uncharacterized protein n=1 Tax=Trifolium medium TaxID=97028 RepID=A0A392PVC4_9FABA|nr:hypothetical protein [Trifolium medium]